MVEDGYEVFAKRQLVTLFSMFSYGREFDNAGTMMSVDETHLMCSFQILKPAEMATHSSTLAWTIPWTEEPGGLQAMGSLESDTTELLHFQFSLSCIGEGNGNPLQCSCLENPRDGEAWCAAVYGVTQSRTRLK